MYYRQPKKSKRRPLLRLCLVLSLLGGAISLYFYYPQLSFYFLSNAFLRLEDHAQKMEERLLSANENPYSTLDALKRAYRLVKLTRANHPANPLAYYYQGLFHFYELGLRLPLSQQQSLLELSGRAFLPQHIDHLTIDTVPVLPLVKMVLLSMRKALTLNPTFLHKSQANIILSYAALLYTGRTDLRELRRIQANQTARFSPLLARYRDWLSLAFYSQLGKKRLLSQLVGEIRHDKKSKAINKKQPQSAASEADPHLGSPSKTRLELNSETADLLLCHGFYRARDYIRALKYARKLKSRPQISKYIEVEALRMEAEIFYIQRGPAAAQAYFAKASLASEKNDRFIEDRIRELYPDGNRY